MFEYEFIVEDDDGIWGAMRATASSIDAARNMVRTYLKDQIEPLGSLLNGYRIRLIDNPDLN